MTPREALQFLKTPSGRLLAFAAVLSAGAGIYLSLRSRSDERPTVPLAHVQKTKPDAPHVVHSVERPITPFKPPIDPPVSLTKTQAMVGVPVTNTVLPKVSLPISLVPASPQAPTPSKSQPTLYAPYGRLIPCETVVTVDSASIQTPIIGLITEDIYHAGQLIIPAGTEVHGTAQTDRLRERIASGQSWTLVWRTGEEMRLKGIALDREFASDQEGWGITDGSAGMRGRIIKSDDLAEIKLFAATLLSGVASSLTEKETTLFGSMDRRSLNNAPLKGAQDVLQVYAQRIHEAIQRDGFYVRVAAGKQFYLYVLQTIDRSEAGIGNLPPAPPEITPIVNIPSPESSLPFPPSEHP